MTEKFSKATLQTLIEKSRANDGKLTRTKLEQITGLSSDADEFDEILGICQREGIEIVDVDDVDPVRMYLEEVGNIPLLTDDEEKILLQQRRSPDENESSAAKKTLVDSNLLLVVEVAKEYVGRGILFLDLIQEGSLGLMEAVEKFDYRGNHRISESDRELVAYSEDFYHRKERRFLHYAAKLIRQHITQAVTEQARTVSLPAEEIAAINKLIRVSRNLLQMYGHEPTDEEIAREMKIPVDRVREIKKIAQEPVSLEMPIVEWDDSVLADFIEDAEAPELSEFLNFTEFKERLDEVLNMLTPRESEVIRLRFGLKDGKARSFEEVGEIFNVTGERIRQIEASALQKLRLPARSKKLKDFLD